MNELLADIPCSDLAHVEGEALVAALRQRFDVVDEEVHSGGHRWRLLRPRSAEALLDEEEFERDGRIPYWVELWPSGQVLGDWLAEDRGPAATSTLLELGCGIGLLSLVAQGLGYDPARILATDYYPEALDFVRANAWLNQLRSPKTALLDWRHLPAGLPRFDRVLAADVLYERENSALIAGAVARTLAPGGLALVTDPGRSTAAHFTACCAEAGLRIDHQHRPWAHGGGVIDLYAVARELGSPLDPQGSAGSR